MHCPSIGEVARDLDATVVVNLATGHIDQYYPTERKDEAEVKELLDDAKTRGSLKVLGMREFLLPGFVDCHAHAPQFSYTGTGLDLPLMGAEGWLERYTFPRNVVLDSTQIMPAWYIAAQSLERFRAAPLLHVTLGPCILRQL